MKFLFHLSSKGKVHMPVRKGEKAIDFPTHQILRK